MEQYDATNIAKHKVKPFTPLNAHLLKRIGKNFANY
jgi:hypothetical protein